MAGLTNGCVLVLICEGHGNKQNRSKLLHWFYRYIACIELQDFLVTGLFWANSTKVKCPSFQENLYSQYSQTSKIRTPPSTGQMIALFYTDIVEIVGSMVGVAYYSLYIYNCIPNLSYGGHPLIKAPGPDKRDLTVAPKQECLKHY